MNCIPTLPARPCGDNATRAGWAVLLLMCLAWCSACSAQATEADGSAGTFNYRIDYGIEPHPADGSVTVTLAVSQRTALLRELSFAADSRIVDLEADGHLFDDSGVIRWQLPATGGTMHWRVRVAHRRNGDSYDAWLGKDWGLFRAEDVIPPLASRTLRGAYSESWLDVTLPRAWSVVTQYSGKNRHFRIDNPERRLDQPNGWIVVGKLGVRRENIAGMRVAVAGPIGQSIRRMDILALLHWTMPELARLLPELPQRLTVVSAREPMWRGGLSAPQSLYLHADRPLISENATSTLLHEVLHMSLGLSAIDGFDWIVEGLAEFYSLELLHRSGTISDSRYAQAKEDLAQWSKDASTLCQSASTGPTTALAVMRLFALDKEMRQVTDGRASLDDLTRSLQATGSKIGLADMRRDAQRIIGTKPDALRIDKLPGCRSIAAAGH